MFERQRLVSFYNDALFTESFFPVFLSILSIYPTIRGQHIHAKIISLNVNG
jgi:hypothetical protein